MSVQAIGAYFDELVQLQGLKVLTVTQNARVRENYISRLLAGDTQDPGAATLRRLTFAVGASWDDVGRLLEPAVTEAEGREMAAQWLSHLTPDLKQSIEELKQTPEGRTRLREAAQRHRK